MKPPKKDRLTLHVYHGLFLTRDQRYSLADGETVETVGVSVPVWSLGGNTSEPASELFCKYVLTNKIGATKITPFGEGYLINIPQLPLNLKIPDAPSNEEWRKMTSLQQERWYAKTSAPKTGGALRDIGDNGAEYLRFHETKRIQRDGRTVTLYHVVEMQDIQELLDTLTV